MKIANYKPAVRQGRRVATFDVEIMEGVRVQDLCLVTGSDGGYRVYGTKISFNADVVRDLARAAVAAGKGGCHEQQ